MIQEKVYVDMEFENYLIQEIHNHPSVRPRDIVKMCYQAAFGAEHLLADEEKARRYFEQEFDMIEPGNGTLYEEISDRVCRVNFAVWKEMKLPKEYLYRIFVESARNYKGDKELFLKYLDIASDVIRKMNESAIDDTINTHANSVNERIVDRIDMVDTINVDKITINNQQIHGNEEEWKKFLEEYKSKGMPVVHHSEEYRNNEKPSYRIVDTSYMRLIPILQYVLKMENNNNYSEKNVSIALNNNKVGIIAIDGRAASGKTTMAEQLSNILDADIVHMDDFFLPLELRTDTRLNEAGGNIHYERFIEEVLSYINIKETFEYRKFDCSVMDYASKHPVLCKSRVFLISSFIFLSRRTGAPARAQTSAL